IDVSIGAQFAVCAIAAGLLAKTGIPMPMVGCGVVVVGAMLGSINAVLIALVGLPSIVVTLAAMVVLRDSIRWGTGGAWLQGLPARFQWFGLGQSAGEWFGAIVACVAFALAAWTLRYLRAGRALYATGSDAEAARLAGIEPQWITFAVFVLMGAATALAALIEAVRFTEIQSNSGLGFELKVIAAVVVGGTSINGGRGSLFGTLLGVAILGAIGPALTFLGISAFWEKAIQGAIILSAVVLDVVVGRRR
ncbi:MAG: ABC transporter permease, partial [Acidobacteriaceae bacterium]|nr:ABC transporter permease [Acidobacteriaceae bacterium]